MKKIIFLVLIFSILIVTGCSLKTHSTKTETLQEIEQTWSENIKNITNSNIEQKKDTLSWVSYDIFIEIEKTLPENTINLEKNTYTVEITPYTWNDKFDWDDGKENIIIYKNWNKIITIKKVKFERLMNNKLFISDWGYRGGSLIIYDLDQEKTIYEKRAFRWVWIEEETNTIRYIDILDIKPDDSKVTCSWSDMYHQGYSLDYNTFELKKEWDVYCQYME